VRWLIAHGADPHASQYEAQQRGTALEYAAGFGHVEVVRLLLASRACAAAAILNYAAMQGHLAVVEALLATSPILMAAPHCGTSAPSCRTTRSRCRQKTCAAS